MIRDKRDEFDDLIRSKLTNYESDDWVPDFAEIENQLTKTAKLISFKRAHYWIAAAIAFLLVGSIGVFYFSRSEEEETMLVAKEETKAEEPISTPIFEEANDKFLAQASSTSTTNQITADLSFNTEDKTAETFIIAKDDSYKAIALGTQPNFLQTKSRSSDEVSLPTPIRQKETRPLIGQTITADLVTGAQPTQKTSRWGFGTGFGGYTVSSSGAVPGMVTNATTITNEILEGINYMLLSPELKRAELAKTNIKHRTPISTGLSVSYYLNSRWALQSGLTYIFLRSSWETNQVANTETVQKLHFLGLPLSVTYKIAEWNRFTFYGAAGGMTEVNIAGTKKAKLIIEGEKKTEMSENVRMKSWQWSVNARAGVSFPLWKFLSAYGEVGAAYYFDNGSAIESVRSEKPFNVSLQAGIRLGF